MAAIISPGGPFTAAKNSPRTFLAAINGTGVDTLQKVRGLKSAVFARITRGKIFCDHAHIGDKGRRLWMINYF